MHFEVASLQLYSALDLLAYLYSADIHNFLTGLATFICCFRMYESIIQFGPIHHSVLTAKCPLTMSSFVSFCFLLFSFLFLLLVNCSAGWFFGFVGYLFGWLRARFLGWLFGWLAARSFGCLHTYTHTYMYMHAHTDKYTPTHWQTHIYARTHMLQRPATWRPGLPCSCSWRHRPPLPPPPTTPWGPSAWASTPRATCSTSGLRRPPRSPSHHPREGAATRDGGRCLRACAPSVSPVGLGDQSC